jgi:hypothetical protein
VKEPPEHRDDAIERGERRPGLLGGDVASGHGHREGGTRFATVTDSATGSPNRCRSRTPEQSRKPVPNQIADFAGALLTPRRGVEVKQVFA